MTDGALVVGYGNVLRSDDGIGWHVADRLAADPRLDGVTVLRLHQLTPELALDVSEASFVILVDARHGPPAGTFVIERVGHVEDASTTWSHHLDPESLVGLALELYGRAPEVFTVGVGIASLDVGDELSPTVAAQVTAITDAVTALVIARAHTAVPVSPMGSTSRA